MKRTRRSGPGAGEPLAASVTASEERSAGPKLTRRRGQIRSAIVVVFALAVLLVAGGYAYWSASVAAPTPEALAALSSDDRVSVVESAWIEFVPRNVTPTTGLVVYPGGLVDARAYAPVARAIAEQGYFVAIVEVPLDFAILAPDRAAEVIAAHPEVRLWATGGHSLGGVAASSFAKRHPNEIAALALWASYPADADDVSQLRLAVVSISGSNDGLATPAKIAAARRLLPAATRYVEIDGGNHSQFGSYGPQRGDGVAAIDPGEQQSRVVAATVDLLRSLSARP